MTLPPDILRTLKDLDRRVRAMETTPQPPNIKLAPSVTATFDISAAGNPNDIIVATATLEDDQDGRLLAIPAYSLYKSVGIPAADRYPFGANWTSGEIRNLYITNWFEWAETDQKNVVYKIMLINKNAFAINDLELTIDWRYMSREVSQA